MHRFPRLLPVIAIPRTSNSTAASAAASAAVSTAVSMALCLVVSTAANAEPIALSHFSEPSASVPEPWQRVVVNDTLKPTQYRVSTVDGITGIEAIADNSMALMGRQIRVDLSKTPVLCWRWRIDAPLNSADMKTKAGDDYAARVYVALSIPPQNMSFVTRAKLKLGRAVFGDQIPDGALNYVWDNRYPVGTTMANAYTDLTRMIVVNSGAAKAGQWLMVRRDLSADIEQHFPHQAAAPTLLAVASDTDNTGEKAHAYFADFRLTTRDDTCH